MGAQKVSVVTGGAGFLGSHLTDRLLSEGHRVIAIDNLITGNPANIAHLGGNENYRFIKHNVSSYILVEDAVDYVFHFASPASPIDYLELPIPTLKVGALGTHNTLGLAKAKKATFVLASTSECYGDPLVHPQTEDYWGNVNPIGPRGVYDESKRFAEAMTMAYHRYHGIDTRICRIFNTYGPRMRPDDGRVVTNFIAQGLRGQPLTVYDDGSRTRSFCYVSDAFVAAGHQVSVIDDLSSGRRENVNPQARFHQVDVQDPTVADVFRTERPEVLCHHAAQMDVRRSVADPLFDARVNILGLLNLLEAARHAGVKRLVFVSSGGAVYGEQETFPAPETHPTNPVSPYGVSKRAGELYAFFFQAEYRLPFVALRYANVYGPRQDPHGEAGVVAIFTGRMLGDEPVVVNGDGRQTRDYVYVGDVARANLLALETRATGPFNIGTGVETDVNALASLLLAAAGSRSQVRHGPPKSGEQRRSVIDCRRAAELLGWRPEVSLAEGLGRTVAWFRERAGAG